MLRKKARPLAIALLGALVAVLLLPGIHPACAQQLGRLEHWQLESVAPVVLRDTAFAGKAFVVVQSSLPTLRFASNLAIFGDRSEPGRGAYLLIVDPRRQILTVSADGFRDLTIDLPALQPRETVGYAVEPAPRSVASGRGTLTVTSEPLGARITSFGGLPADQETPYTFDDIPAQAYALVLEKEKYEPLDTVLVVAPGAEVTQRLRLTPTFGFVRLRANRRARLQLDGTAVLWRPGDALDVPAGTHTVSLAMDHFEPFDTTVTVTPGDTVDLGIRLQRARTALTVRSSPDSARVIIDGEDVGLTPYAGALEAGRTYRVRLEREGHLPFEENVFVRADGPEEQRVLLQPFEARAPGGGVAFANVRLDRQGDQATITYDLLGRDGKKHRVELVFVDPAGEEVRPVDLDRVSGDIGKGIRPGSGKRIVWRVEAPRDLGVRLQVAPQRRSPLLYVLGGVAVAGGGTAAALLLSGGGSGEGGGATSVAPPPGRPQ